MGEMVVIYNPNARRNRKDPKKKDRLKKILANYGEFIVTSSLDQVKDIALSCKERDIDLLGICGGDGTYHICITSFLDVYGEKKLPPLALLRGGTINNISNSFGIPKSAENSLEFLVKKHKEGEKFLIKEADIMKIGDKYGFIFGVGVASNFLDVYYSGDGNGPHYVAYVLIKGILSIITNGSFHKKICEKVHLKVKTKNITIENDFSAILAATVKDLGFGFKPAYRADTVKGKFHLLLVLGDATYILSNLHRCFLGKPFKGNEVYDELEDYIKLESEKPFIYTIDGEIYKAKELIVKISHKLDMIVG